MGSDSDSARGGEGREVSGQRARLGSVMSFTSCAAHLLLLWPWTPVRFVCYLLPGSAWSSSRASHVKFQLEVVSRLHADCQYRADLWFTTVMWGRVNNPLWAASSARSLWTGRRLRSSTHLEFVGSRITPGNLTWPLCVYSAVTSVRFESLMLPCVAQLALSFTSVWTINYLRTNSGIQMRRVLGVHSEKQNNPEKIATVVCFEEARLFVSFCYCYIASVHCISSS